MDRANYSNKEGDYTKDMKNVLSQKKNALHNIKFHTVVGDPIDG